jgi:hypothetical protein
MPAIFLYERDIPEKVLHEPHGSKVDDIETRDVVEQRLEEVTPDNAGTLLGELRAPAAEEEDVLHT